MFSSAHHPTVQSVAPRSASGPGRRALKALPGLAAGLVLTLTAAACSSGSGSSASPAHTAAPTTPSPAAMSLLGAHSLPAQASQTMPAFPAYYDAHKDLVIVTDAFPKPAAGMFHANFAPSLAMVKPASQPAWYIVHGKAAAGQLAVLGSEPGESDYSPLWRTVIVTWQPGVTPKVLTSDNMILSLAKKGKLTTQFTSKVVNATVTTVKGRAVTVPSAPVSMLGAHSLPAQTTQTLPSFPAFYDAHKDVVLVSDAYPKSASVTYHTNYAPSLSAVKAGSQPAWYIVHGKAAAGQLAVLGSEPGESDYSPLWQTVFVTWQPGVTPKVLTSDNMILSLAKKGELTTRFTPIVVNATVVSKP